MTPDDVAAMLLLLTNIDNGLMAIFWVLVAHALLSIIK